MIKNRKLTIVLGLLLIMSLGLVGCSSERTSDKGTVEILYVEWACASATSHVIADILENKMGYDVELTPVTAAVMYEGLSNGDGDATFCTWLPVTHGEYMKNIEGTVEDLGPNMEEAKIGLVVPEYVTIASIEEMNGAKDKFNKEIIGIDPGAGIMKCCEAAIEDYDLDYSLVEGSDATMVAALKSAVDNDKWVAVTGWTPHWKFARWDLKYLDDPKKSFGEAETINTVVRDGLKEDMPEVYELFNNFHWTTDDLGNAMVMATEDGETSSSAAHKWVAENEELVNSWLPDSFK